MGVDFGNPSCGLGRDGGKNRDFKGRQNRKNKMKIISDGMHVSVTGLNDEEYAILIGALREAAKDIETPQLEYTLFYGTDRGAVVRFFNDFWAEDDNLRKRQ